MKQLNTLLLFFSLTMAAMAQPVGYYNGTENLSGEELKTALHEIIKGHVDFSYSDAKYIMNYADQDPDNSDNIILFYTRRSQSNSSWGSGDDDANREHVWAKSHGDFADIRPMDGDAFNLHPADASVNSARLHYDFDSVPRDLGTYIEEAEAYVYGTNYQFEPADISKGRVARTIFYMATRYEGTDGEMDLEVVDALNTSSAAEHGKLSTLLKWNNQFPPDEFERRRNERVYESQRNRNPFIDNPEFANLIWGESSLSDISISDMEMTPEFPQQATTPTLSVDISSEGSEQVTATLYWSDSYDGETYSAVMSASDATYSAAMDFSSFAEGDWVYYKVVATSGDSEQVLYSNYRLPKSVTLTAISDVQGTGSASPITGQTVTISGIVSANFDGSYYIQSDSLPYSGVCIYNMQTGKIGDSVVVTGKVVEYQNLTEMGSITDTYVYPAKNELKVPTVTIGEIDESYEGMLVYLPKTTFSEGGSYIDYDSNTFTLTDGTNSIDVYCRYNSRMSGNTLPSGDVDVYAVVSQYKDNLQLLIHSMDYINYTADSEAPVLSSLTVLSATQIQLNFDETLESTSATNVENYSITNDITVESAVVLFNTKVILTVSEMPAGNYTLSINGVEDQFGNATNISTDFSYNTTAVDETSAETFVAYPNPNAGEALNIQAQQAIAQVQVYGLNGALVKVFTGNNMQFQSIDLKGLDNGMYLLEIQYINGNSSTQKLVIE